jgi:hypothetical protein
MIGPSFVTEAYKKLGPLPGVGELVVELDDEFDWDADDMAVGYRNLLARRRAAGAAVLLALRPPGRAGS